MMPKLELRPFQRQVLENFSIYPHQLCLSPTGSGKSLIFERLALEGLAKPRGLRMVLFTPLVALHRQHADRLNRQGIKTWLSGANPPRGFEGVWILSPESIRLTHARDWNATHLVVDECHTLWEWGSNFRPAFRVIFDWIARCKPDFSLWLTATLSPSAKRDLAESLSKVGVGWLHVHGEFRLPEMLTIRVAEVPTRKRIFQLRLWAQQHQKGIVFVRSRTLAENLAERWNGPCWAYHAGLSKEERTAREAHFSRTTSGILFATSAFGMGMDVRDIASVLYYGPPFSMTEMAQGLGRCARELQRPSFGYVWFDPFDVMTLHRMSTAAEAAAVMRFLKDRDRCRVLAFEDYFKSAMTQLPGRKVCGRCDHCIAMASVPSRNLATLQSC